MSISVNQRRAVFLELKDYCFHSGDHDFIEIIEWSNGEGYDVVIDRKRGCEKFSLTHGEFELLTVLMNWRDKQ